MDKSYLTNMLLLIGLVLIQVLVCNHIMLFDVAMAFVFIYVIIRLPMNLSTNWLLTWGFISGFLVDLFSDTPGVNSMACTVLAMVKKPMLYAYIPKDDRTKDIIPSLSTLGFSIYGKYLFSMTLVYCILTFSLEYFNFADVKEIVIMSATSAVFTFLLLLSVDSLIVTRREKRL
ncbi:MAG: rod shape-determining protein MreD [Bacteroides sp.]|nr:rod shape-determining protein MreD [Bacteroidales bacterium]MBD5206432.1 rod shape-determining protein MreD [Bacteroidales bacterium]MBD5224263.1 rod shape-determining protein MreD [Bacteroidales bacterium]MBD5305472.1 rod shape-determining protein MreD [Bacteroides sp.]MBD5349147.1 rod shape-determining protein MreD [Bacteroides sp.]